MSEKHRQRRTLTFLFTRCQIGSFSCDATGYSYCDCCALSAFSLHCIISYFDQYTDAEISNVAPRSDRF